MTVEVKTESWRATGGAAALKTVGMAAVGKALYQDGDMMNIGRKPTARAVAERGLARALLIAVAVLTAPTSSHAQNMQKLIKVDIWIAPDLSMNETVRTETTPLVESTVRSASQARWDISGNQCAELVEAFTRKADGRIIPADLHDLTTQDGVVGQAMSFVDLKLQQIPFRDVAVGDTTVVTIRFKESQHYIPGQYSQGWVVLPGGTKQSLDVTLRVPASLALYHDAKDLAYEETQEGDDVVRHWSGSPPHLSVEETNVANLVRVAPSLRFSTFPNYEAIARAYDDGSRPMAIVTPEVQRLADEITTDKTDVGSQAEAIFDWVSRNIRYVAAYFGNGRYVPNDTQTILSRRFGDCKDHATLLVALLAEGNRERAGTDQSGPDL